MNVFLQQFSQSYMVVPLVVVLAMVITFINGKISDKAVEAKDYIKVSILTIIVSSIVVYINIIGAGTVEEITSGPVPF